jgi:hypothetical protein
MDIDVKIKASARNVAQHLGTVAGELGKQHESYRDMQELRLSFYRLAHANLFPDSDLQAGASQILSYLEQTGDMADPQIVAFRDANESLLKELAGNEAGITPPKKPTKTRR